MAEPAKVHGSQAISMCQSEKSKNKVYTIISSSIWTLRYKRKTTDRQQTDTEADLHLGLGLQEQGFLPKHVEVPLRYGSKIFTLR